MMMMMMMMMLLLLLRPFVYNDLRRLFIRHFKKSFLALRLLGLGWTSPGQSFVLEALGLCGKSPNITPTTTVHSRTVPSGPRWICIGQFSGTEEFGPTQ
jgi:hypothetical protein